MSIQPETVLDTDIPDAEVDAEVPVETPEIEKPTLGATSTLDEAAEGLVEDEQNSMDMAVEAPELEELPEYGGPEYTTETQYSVESWWPGQTGQEFAGGNGMLPVQGGSVSYEYGVSNSRYASGRHEGVDIAVPVGTPVQSVLGGTVRWAKWAGAYGNAMLIQQDDGTYSLVAHLSQFRAKAGQRVEAGQVIALSGNTGRSTGPHLHWEIRTGPQYGSSIDPMGWVGRTSQGSGSSAGGGGSTGNLANLAQQAGFTASQARIMAAIAMAESSGNPRAHNPNWRTGDDSYGLWQINMLGDMGPSRRRAFGIRNNSQLFDPLVNARAAKTIFDWQGFNAWSVYRSGAYRRFL